MKLPEKLNINELMSKINEKHRYYFLAGFLLVIFLLDYFLIIKGQLATMNDLNPKLTILKQDIVLAKDNIAQINVYQNALSKLNEKIKNSNIKILLKEEVPMILEGISKLAERNKVKIEQIMPAKGSQEQILSNAEGKYYSFPIIIEAKGGYHAIGHFIDQIEKDEVFKSITLLKIAGTAEDPSRHSLKITIKAIILDKPQS